MPKKDTSAAVLGMLSTAGAQTRPAAVEPPAPTAPAEPVIAAPAPAAPPPAAASVRTLPTSTKTAAADEAPRTLRLRPATAARLRAAWLEAKRDDVLLTAQDFASNLVEEALVRHSRRTASTS